MADEADVYRRLQRHLDELPVGYPATASGVELRILERLFTPEEAEVALALSCSRTSSSTPARASPARSSRRRPGRCGQCR
jgi:hypothetical protein